MKRLAVILVFSFIGFLGVAQEQLADSLIKLLPAQKADTNKCLLLTDIARAYIAASDFENAMDYSQQQLELSEKLNFKRGELTANNNIGLSYFYRSNFPKCLEYYFKALKVAEEAKFKIKELKILSNIGAVYYTTEDYTQTKNITIKVIELAKVLKDTSTLATQYSIMGLVQRHDAKEMKDTFKQRELRIKALRNFQTAIYLDSILDNKKNMGSFLTNVGLLFEDLKDPKNQLLYHLYSLKLKKEAGDEYGAGICYGNLGAYYFQQHNFLAADTCLKASLKIALETGDLESSKDMYSSLSALNRKQNKWELAYSNFVESIRFRDSMTNEKSTKKQVEIRMNYEYDKKEAVLKANAKKEQEKQRLIIYSVCIGLFLVILFAGFMYNRFKVTQRQKKLIEHQKEEIVSSIRYAKRIQQSLLPQDKYIEKNLKKK